MAKLPIYQQRYQVGSRRASEEDFGAGEARAQQQFGQGLTGLGDALVGIEQKRRSRQETIERVRAINDYELLAQEEMTRLSTQEDLANTDVPVQYSNYLANERDRIVQEHAGSQASKDELAARLEASGGVFSRDMYKQSTSAQFKTIDTYLERSIKGMADNAGNMPDTIEAQFMSLDNTIADMVDVLTTEQEQAYRTQGRSMIIRSAMDTYLASGDYDAVAMVLDSDGVSETLAPEVMRTYKSKVLVGQRQEEIARQEVQNKIGVMEHVLGRPLTDAEKQQALGLTSGKRTIAQDIADFERLTGQPATAEQVARFYDVDDDTNGKGLYGSSLRGLATERVNTNVSAFASGIMSPAQDQVYIADVLEAYGPIKYTDPITGQASMRPGKPAPPHIIEALNRRGMTHILQGQGTGVEPVAADPNVGVAPYQEGQRSIFDMITNVSGPVSAVEGMLEGVPFIGHMQEQDVTRDRTRLSGLQRNVVTALQNNPKYAEGERKAIEQEISLLPGIFSNPENATAKLISVDENLEQRQNSAYATANDRSQPVATRQQAMNVFNLVSNVRSQFNLPPKVKTRDEAMKLPPGSLFINPNGVIMRVPTEVPANGE